MTAPSERTTALHYVSGQSLLSFLVPVDSRLHILLAWPRRWVMTLLSRFFVRLVPACLFAVMRSMVRTGLLPGWSRRPIPLSIMLRQDNPTAATRCAPGGTDVLNVAYPRWHLLILLLNLGMLPK